MGHDIAINGGRVVYEKNSGLSIGKVNIGMSNGTIDCVAHRRLDGTATLGLSDNHLVIPGFYGSHSHGGGDLIAPAFGRYYPDASSFRFYPNAVGSNIIEVLEAHGREGTTSMHISAAAVPERNLKAFVQAAGELHALGIDSKQAASFLGIDLEGLFLAPDGKHGIVNPNAGAQNPEWFSKPDMGYLENLMEMANGTIRRVCVGMDWDDSIYSGELPARNMVEHLVSRRIPVGFGHTYANQELVKAAIFKNGRYVWAHMGNGQGTLMNKAGRKTMHEAPGEIIAEARKKGADFFAEVITDYRHVDSTYALMVRSLFGPERMILVDDNGCGSGKLSVERFRIAKQWVEVHKDKHGYEVFVVEGTNGQRFYGSNCTMQRCFLNYINMLMECDENGNGPIPMYRKEKERHKPLRFENAVKEATMAACMNPARLYMHDSQIGSIKKGKQADLLVFEIVSDKYPVQLKLERVIRNGEKVR